MRAHTNKHEQPTKRTHTHMHTYAFFLFTQTRKSPSANHMRARAHTHSPKPDLQTQPQRSRRRHTSLAPTRRKPRHTTKSTKPKAIAARTRIPTATTSPQATRPQEAENLWGTGGAHARPAFAPRPIQCQTAFAVAQPTNRGHSHAPAANAPERAQERRHPPRNAPHTERRLHLATKVTLPALLRQDRQRHTHHRRRAKRT